MRSRRLAPEQQPAAPEALASPDPATTSWVPIWNMGPQSTPVPPVVNGQWVKGVGGAAVWAPITITDLPFPRIVAAGTINGDGSIRSGAGFTAAHLSAGNYRITIPTAISGGVIVACAWPQSTVCGAATESATTFIVYLTTPGAWTDTIFQFIILALV